MFLIQTFLPTSNIGPSFSYNMDQSPEKRSGESKAATVSYINGTSKQRPSSQSLLDDLVQV